MISCTTSSSSITYFYPSLITLFWCLIYLSISSIFTEVSLFSIKLEIYCLKSGTFKWNFAFLLFFLLSFSISRRVAYFIIFISKWSFHRFFFYYTKNKNASPDSFPRLLSLRLTYSKFWTLLIAKAIHFPPSSLILFDDRSRFFNLMFSLLAKA